MRKLTIYIYRRLQLKHNNKVQINFAKIVFIYYKIIKETYPSFERIAKKMLLEYCRHFILTVQSSCRTRLKSLP